MMMRLLSVLSIGCLFITFSGCSSSQTSDIPPDDASEAAAGTDAVPMESGDNAPVDAASTELPTPPASDPGTTDTSKTVASTSGSTSGPDDLPLAPPADGQAQASAPAPAPADAPAAASPELAQNSVPAPAPAVVPAPPADVTPPPAASPDSGDGGAYTVHPGDTLMRIAFQSYGDLYKWKDIYEANRSQIKDPNLILPGAVLKIPGGAHSEVAHNGERREIHPGETLGTIAKQVYGTPSKWKALWANNQDLIKDPNRIFAGFFIYYTASPEDLKNTPAPLAEEQAPAPVAAPLSETRGPASVKTSAAPVPMQMMPVTPNHS